MINYIFCFFLSLSVVSSIFELATIQSHKNHKIIKNFEHYTKELLRPKGIGTITGLCFLLLTSSLFMFFIQKSLIEYRELNYRKETYLCFNHYANDLKKLSKKIAQYNLAITLINAGKLTVVGATTAEAAKKILNLSLEYYYLSFMKNQAENQHCTVEQKSYLLYQFPYETKAYGSLSLNPLGLTIIKRSQWNLYFFRKPQNIRYSKIFTIVAQMQIENVFKEVVLVNSREVSQKVFQVNYQKALLNWKPLSG